LERPNPDSGEGEGGRGDSKAWALKGRATWIKSCQVSTSRVKGLSRASTSEEGWEREMSFRKGTLRAGAAFVSVTASAQGQSY
jgi:hypothetical protein